MFTVYLHLDLQLLIHQYPQLSPMFLLVNRKKTRPLNHSLNLSFFHWLNLNSSLNFALLMHFLHSICYLRIYLNSICYKYFEPFSIILDVTQHHLNSFPEHMFHFPPIVFMLQLRQYYCYEFQPSYQNDKLALK